MKKIVILLVLFLPILMGAQKSPKEIKGDKYYEQFSFAKAIEKYSTVDGLTTDGKRRLAVAYKNTNQIAQSKATFETFIASSDITPEDLFNYASILRLNGNYDESITWLEKFKAAAPTDNRAVVYEKSAAQLPKLHKDEGRYKITHLDINTSHQDFGPSFFKEQIVFASTREGVKSIKRSYNWNEMPYLDLFVAEINMDQLENPKQLHKQLNNKLHEGPASFNGAGTLMAFTRNNYSGKSQDGAIKLQIFFSTLNEKGEWIKEESFKLNNSEYNVAHPCLSADGRIMYFSSDMPGGIGGADIYRIEKNANGTWGEAVNLGPSINTEGNELFPFYQEEQGILFFASNGHIGLGGLDIFLSPDLGNGEFVKVLNAGTPMNTRFDDFGLIIDEKMRKGYFSSNREGGKGDDDIYAFELLKPYAFGKKITGVSKDTEGNIIAGAKISFFDADGNLLKKVTTREDGYFEFDAEADKDYKLYGKKEDYFDGKNAVSTKVDEDKLVADVILEKDPGLSLYALIRDKKSNVPLPGVKMTVIDNMTGVVVEIITPETGDYLRPLNDKKLNDRGSYNFVLQKEGYFTKTITYNEHFVRPGIYEVSKSMDLSLDPEVKDLSEMVKINPINFDYNKSNIRKDAAIELDKIVEIMNKYPDMVIELGSHTDCRGSAKYNESLSDKRAKASAAYIKSKITNPERIYGKGYGESKIINGCACEGSIKSECSEEQHEENRRTEFKVISSGNDKVKIINTSPNSK
jgi:outer membrane protein OmpA-like peptidoglycan-associated protein/tetratricopeptide (TPR) repeat protein